MDGASTCHDSLNLDPRDVSGIWYENDEGLGPGQDPGMRPPLPEKASLLVLAAVAGLCTAGLELH